MALFTLLLCSQLFQPESALWTADLPSGSSAGAQAAADGEWAAFTSNAGVEIRRYAGGAWSHFQTVPGSGDLDLDAGRLIVAGATIYAFDGFAWNLEATLSAPSTITVAISGDWAAVGGNTEWGGSDEIALFARGPGGWALDTMLQRPPQVEAGERFGASFDLSGDWLLAGAPQFDDGDIFSWGGAFLYERTAAGWQYAQQLAYGSNKAAFLGTAVALHDDVAVVGEPGPTAGFHSILVFRRSGGVWLGAGGLSGSDGLGGSVATDGQLVAAAALRWVEGEQGIACVYALERNASGGFEPASRWRATDGRRHDGLGVVHGRLAIAGGTILAGARDRDGATGTEGGVYLFDVAELPLAATHFVVDAGAGRIEYGVRGGKPDGAVRLAWVTRNGLPELRLLATGRFDANGTWVFERVHVPLSLAGTTLRLRAEGESPSGAWARSNAAPLAIR